MVLRIPEGFCGPNLFSSLCHNFASLGSHCELTTRFSDFVCWPTSPGSPPRSNPRCTTAKLGYIGGSSIAKQSPSPAHSSFKTALLPSGTGSNLTPPPKLLLPLPSSPVISHFIFSTLLAWAPMHNPFLCNSNTHASTLLPSCSDLDPE